LKERSKQLKEMVLELKNYQSQVQAYRFEIDRVDKIIQDAKETYFKMKSKQDFGPIEEMDEENYNDGDIGMQQQLAGFAANQYQMDYTDQPHQQY
jgi:hypothetical protein